MVVIRCDTPATWLESSFERIRPTTPSSPVMRNFVEASEIVGVFLEIRTHETVCHVREDADHGHEGCLASACSHRRAESVAPRRAFCSSRKHRKFLSLISFMPDFLVTSVSALFRCPAAMGYMANAPASATRRRPCSCPPAESAPWPTPPPSARPGPPAPGCARRPCRASASAATSPWSSR